MSTDNARPPKIRASVASRKKNTSLRQAATAANAMPSAMNASAKPVSVRRRASSLCRTAAITAPASPMAELAEQALRPPHEDEHHHAEEQRLGPDGRDVQARQRLDLHQDDAGHDRALDAAHAAYDDDGEG